MDVLINSIVGILSQCIQRSNHHIVHIKYITILFINYVSINWKRKYKSRNSLNEALSKVLINLKETCLKMMRQIEENKNRNQKYKIWQWLFTIHHDMSREMLSLRLLLPEKWSLLGSKDSSLNFTKIWMNHSAKSPIPCDLILYPPSNFLILASQLWYQ